MTDLPTQFAWFSTASALGAIAQAEADGLVVLARYRVTPLLHSIKLDKKGAPRSYCGVPITSAGTWRFDGYGTLEALTCPTCQAALRKAANPAARRAPPETTERASPLPALCLAVQDDQAIRNPLTRGMAHTPHVLKTNYHGEVVPVTCAWCGQSIDRSDTPTPASGLDSQGSGVV